MTTITWDGKTLASDSQVSCEYIRQGGVKKIINKKGKSYGWTGSQTTCEKFLETGSGLAPNDVVFEIDQKSGKCLEHYDDGYTVSKPPAAIGSGKVAAMGAMLHGATAVEAVKIAIKLDPNSGGRVQSVKIK